MPSSSAHDPSVRYADTSPRMSVGRKAQRRKALVRHRTRRALLFWCFLAPSLAIFLLYRIIPVVWNLVLSFQYWSPLAEAEPAGLDHYEDLLQDEVFWQALWNTVVVIASAPIGIAGAPVLALLVHADIRGLPGHPHIHLPPH